MSFWKDKTLSEMNHEEWESLCDGCGKCCLNKIEDEDTGEIFYTNVRCKLLDAHKCRCTSYHDRIVHVPTCVVLSPSNVPMAVRFMPKTCAYRLVHEGQDLPEWHHLVCGDRDRVHREKRSVQGQTVTEDQVKDWEDHVVKV